MRYSILTLLSLLLIGCKAQKLTFEKAEMQKGVSGVQGGKQTFTFTLITPAKEKSIDKFTKLWYNHICYTIQKQNISKEKEGTKVVLFTQDPPKGFRSSKSPIPLTENVMLVVELSKDGVVEHLAVGKVDVEQTISYPSAPPSE